MPPGPLTCTRRSTLPPRPSRVGQTRRKPGSLQPPSGPTQTHARQAGPPHARTWYAMHAHDMHHADPTPRTPTSPLPPLPAPKQDHAGSQPPIAAGRVRPLAIGRAPWGSQPRGCRRPLIRTRVRPPSPPPELSVAAASPLTAVARPSRPRSQLKSTTSPRCACLVCATSSSVR